MSSRLDRRRAGPSRVLIGGLARHFAAPPLVPKKGKQKNRTVAGGHRPAGRTGRNRPDTSTLALLLHCRVATPTDRQPRHRPQGAALATVSSCPFQRCRSAAARHPGACDPARERQRAVTSSISWCGSILSRGSTPGLHIHSRRRSPRSPKLPDRNCFPRKPHRIARREPPVDSNRPGQQWTDVRGQAGERSQDPGRGQADLAVEYPVYGRFMEGVRLGGCSFGERQGRRTYTISRWVLAWISSCVALERSRSDRGRLDEGWQTAATRRAIVVS